MKNKQELKDALAFYSNGKAATVNSCRTTGVKMEQDDDKLFPFDRVIVMGQADGTWISVYIRRGFKNQEEAIEDVAHFLGSGEIEWGEFAVETEEADLSSFVQEQKEPVETALPDYMKEMWDTDDV